MSAVSITQYPKREEWNKKINSTPSIPGGKDKVIQNLKKLLLYIQNDEPMDQIPDLDESSSKSTLQDLCIHQLSPMSFVRRSTNGKWVLTDEAKLWLDSQDNIYLAAFFCVNVKFFAEILFYLDSPKTSRELFNIAVNEYDLAWKIPTTINNRLVWLRQFGLIEFQEFSLLYSITEAGKAFLKTVNPLMPEDIRHGEDDTISENSIEINDSFITFYQENKHSVRKMGLGYIPGKTEELSHTLSSFISHISNHQSIEDINEFTLKEYKIKDSSTRSALNTISSLGLIERKTNTTYVITDLGYSWLENRDIFFLLPSFQIRYLFFFEMLLELKYNNLSGKELATLAKISYGFDKDNTFEIYNRIAILKQAKLIMNSSAEKFTLTHRGILFLNTYGDLFNLKKYNESNTKKAKTDNVDIISELRMASKDSFNPNRFEKVVRDFFGRIGFDATWLGGAGQTDVLLKTTGSPIDSFLVTVDAKSTASNTVTDGLVDFDTLEEHRKKHGSDYIAVVGRNFNDRLIKRAIEHGVVLFDVDTLENLLALHQRAPQKISTYRKLFSQSGKAQLSILDTDIDRMENTGSLMIAIMRRLIEECSDPITKGQLSVRDLYMSLRNNLELSSAPNIEDIEMSLSFLSSAIIGCVVREKDYYYATGSLADMAQILGFLKEKCK